MPRDNATTKRQCVLSQLKSRIIPFEFEQSTKINKDSDIHPTDQLHPFRYDLFSFKYSEQRALSSSPSTTRRFEESGDSDSREDEPIAKSMRLHSLRSSESTPMHNDSNWSSEIRSSKFQKSWIRSLNPRSEVTIEIDGNSVCNKAKTHRIH